MSNKVYIKNNLARAKNKEELAKELEEEGKKTLLWGFQKERTKEEADNEKEKPKE